MCSPQHAPDSADVHGFSNRSAVDEHNICDDHLEEKEQSKRHAEPASRTPFLVRSDNLAGDFCGGPAPQTIARAREINERMREGITDPLSGAQVLALNRQFHATIYMVCGNSFVVDLVTRVWDLIDANRAIVSMYGGTRLESAVEEHEQLLEDLTTGKSPAALEHAARQHNLNAIVAFRRSANAMTIPSADPAELPPEPTLV